MAGNALQELLEQRGDLAGFSGEDTLPTRRSEAFKYTDLRRLDTVGWTLWDQDTPHGVTAVPKDPLGLGSECLRLVIVNGILDEALSDIEALPPGLSVQVQVPDPLEAEDFAGRLNTALAAQEVVITVDSGATVERPLHVMQIGWAPSVEGCVAHAGRLSVVVGSNASVSLIESHFEVQGTGFSNPTLTLDIADSASLTHHVVFAESEGAARLSRTDVSVAASGRYESFLLSIGSGLGRRETRLQMTGDQGEARVSGAYVSAGDGLVDNTTLVVHDCENAKTNQFFRGVVDDSARGVFQGKVIVREGARGTDGQQQHKALLLSPKAEVNAKPELEIYNDDVQCAHGATVGALDADQLFYLRARGIPEAQARAILTESFLLEAIETISHETLREVFREALTVRLNGAAA